MRKINHSLKILPFFLLSLTLALTLRSDDFFAVKDKVIGESRFKLSFLYFTPLILLENAGYTSSVFTYDANDNPDWTGDIGLGLRASAVLANRLILQAEDMPYYSFYLENKNLRSWSNRFAAAAYSYVGPFNLKAGFRRDDLRQRPQLEFSRPYHYVDSEWLGEADIGRNSRFFLTAYVRFNRFQYKEDSYQDGSNLAERLDHRQDIFGLQLNQVIFTRTMLFASYELNTYTFDQAEDRDTRAHKLTLGLKLPDIGILKGSFQVGVKQFVPGNPLFRRTLRPTGRGDVSLTVFERLRFSLFYQFETHFSYYASDQFYDNRTLGGGVELFLATFLKGGARYQDGRLKYRSFLDLAAGRSDRIRLQRYYLAAPFIGNTSLGVSYNVYRLTSDVLGLDILRKYWGGFISYEF